MATKFFSKKLLVYFILIIFSTNLYSAPKMGKVNMDTIPFKIILDKYYDTCDDAVGDSLNGFDKKSMDAVKPLLLAPPSDENARLSLGSCKSDIMNYKGEREIRGKKPDLTKIRKVSQISYNSNNKTYIAFYDYYKVQEEINNSFTLRFRPIKDSNGKIVWKLMR